MNAFTPRPYEAISLAAEVHDHPGPDRRRNVGHVGFSFSSAKTARASGTFSTLLSTTFQWYGEAFASILQANSQLAARKAEASAIRMKRQPSLPASSGMGLAGSGAAAVTLPGQIVLGDSWKMADR
ncbi:MAG: hypothetical protein ACRD0Q_01180 [Acidimicrobiales bacterium]